MPKICYHGIISRCTEPRLYRRVVAVSLGVNKVSWSAVFFAHTTQLSRRWKICASEPSNASQLEIFL